MLIKILIYGGLGNQLFQVAFGESLKITHNHINIKYIDLTKYAYTKRKWELGFLNIKPLNISKREIYSIFFKRFINSKLNKFNSNFLYLGIINEKQYKYIQNYLEKNRNFILDGYWQSEKYFSDNKVDIKTLLNRKNKNFSINNRDSKNQKVAVHIRLGDYINTLKGRKNHLVCNFEWYKNAIIYLKDFNKDLKFTVFSDDKELIKNEFRNFNNLEIYDSDYSNSAYEDLFEMTKYDHFIISNSSYSWWASYLGEKENSKIIAPKYWSRSLKTKEFSLYRENLILL